MSLSAVIKFICEEYDLPVDQVKEKLETNGLITKKGTLSKNKKARANGPVVTCKALKLDGTPCTWNSEPGGQYCGKHAGGSKFVPRVPCAGFNARGKACKHDRIAGRSDYTWNGETEPVFPELCVVHNKRHLEGVYEWPLSGVVGNADVEEGIVKVYDEEEEEDFSDPE